MTGHLSAAGSRVQDPAGPDTSGDEARVLRRVSEGSEEAFLTLYRAHTPHLYRLGLRLCGGRPADAEEVVQETWRRAVSGAASFQGRSQVRRWLKGIAARVALERARQNERRIRDETMGHVVHPGAASPPGRASAEGRSAIHIDLARVVAQLAPGYRAVLILHDVEGFRHAEIGKLLGISPGTSKSQLSRARGLIRNALGEEYVRE